MDSDFIIKALKKLHPCDEKVWSNFVELRIGCGYGKDSEQRLDFWTIHNHPSKRNITRCYEIKASRGDYLNELKKPLKRRPGLRLSNEFVFATPPGLLKIEEIPPECGLIEIDENGKTKMIVQPPFRDIMPPTWLFLASIARRATLSDSLKEEAEKRVKLTKAEKNIQAIKELDRRIEHWKTATGNKEFPEMIIKELELTKRNIEEDLGFIRSSLGL